MDSETIQPTRIDKREYELFKEFVRDVHGKTRGHLSTEIENALREYRKSTTGNDSLTRIEDDIATIKAQLAVESDGGSTATPSPSDDNTHAHAENTTSTDSPTEKPAANAPRGEKVEYLINTKYNRGGGSLSVNGIKEDIKRLYHFGDRTAKKFVQPVIDELDAKKHPNNPQVLVWGSAIDDLMQSEEEETD